MPARKPKPLERISRKEIWGIPLLLLTGWVYAFLSLMFDVVLLNHWSPLWILIFIIKIGRAHV